MLWSFVFLVGWNVSLHGGTQPLGEWDYMRLSGMNPTFSVGVSLFNLTELYLSFEGYTWEGNERVDWLTYKLGGIGLSPYYQFELGKLGFSIGGAIFYGFVLDGIEVEAGGEISGAWWYSPLIATGARLRLLYPLAHRLFVSAQTKFMYFVNMSAPVGPSIELGIVKGFGKEKKVPVERKPIVVRVKGRPAMSRPDGIAVVIGVKEYDNEEIPAVDFAIRDALAVKAYLVKVLGFREGNIIYLENPSKADLERVFGTTGNPKGKLYNWTKPNKSDVFVYYSGHGVPDIKTKKAYLLPRDADPHYATLSGYALETLYGNLECLPARSVTVVIDACFSGVSSGGSLMGEVSGISVVPREEKAEGINVFTATSGDETAGWYTEKGHSLFTYYFLEAVSGKGDSNKDGKVTLGEVYTYVKDHVLYYSRRKYGRDQTPRLYGDLDAVVVKFQQ